MISGLVVHGDGIGRTLGYPTANIVPAEEMFLEDGVYAAWVLVREHRHGAALVISQKGKKIEVYLLDYSGQDLYGTHLAVDPVQQVSAMQRLTEEDLEKKIERDITLIRSVLGI